MCSLFSWIKRLKRNQVWHLYPIVFLRFNQIYASLGQNWGTHYVPHQHKKRFSVILFRAGNFPLAVPGIKKSTRRSVQRCQSNRRCRGCCCRGGDCGGNGGGKGLTGTGCHRFEISGESGLASRAGEKSSAYSTLFAIRRGPHLD